MGPAVAISVGDPAGIGPETTAACLSDAPRGIRPLVFGHWPTVERAIERSGTSLPVDVVDSPSAPRAGRIAFVHTGPDCPPIDSPCAAGARSQLEAVESAVDAVLGGVCEALVTAPVSKAQIASLLPGFTGHTEHLAHRDGVAADRVTMIFASPSLAVALATTHLALRDVPAALTERRYERTLLHLADLLARLHPGISPRIAVAGLNPHAGEEGLIGDEEERILAPACRSVEARLGIDVAGPVPADAVFRTALAGEYDGVVAAYHDQATIPLKLAGPGRFANVTMGLSFARTSPDHGVAYDIAGTGRADPSGMRLAIDTAARLCATPGGVGA